MPLIGIVVRCASILLAAVPAMSLAQASAAPAAPLSAAESVQRGTQLRAEIDACYQQLRTSRALKNAVHDGNDVTATVLEFIPVGTRLDDATAILRAAGGTIEPPQHGHIDARIRMKDGLLDLKHTLTVELSPQDPGDFTRVHAVAATIYLQYVPNANNR